MGNNESHHHHYVTNVVCNANVDPNNSGVLAVGGDVIAGTNNCGNTVASLLNL